jgi:hypothetical protein
MTINHKLPFPAARVVTVISCTILILQSRAITRGVMNVLELEWNVLARDFHPRSRDEDDSAGCSARTRSWTPSPLRLPMPNWPTKLLLRRQWYFTLLCSALFLTFFTMTMTALFLFHSTRYSSEPICRADQAAVPLERGIPREPPTFSMNPSARRSSVGPWISWFHGSDGSAGRQVTSFALATFRCSGEPPTAPHFQVAANAKKGARNRRWTARCP